MRKVVFFILLTSAPLWAQRSEQQVKADIGQLYETVVSLNEQLLTAGQRIQDLQTQLNNVTHERDAIKLKCGAPCADPQQ